MPASMDPTENEGLSPASALAHRAGTAPVCRPTQSWHGQSNSATGRQRATSSPRLKDLAQSERPQERMQRLGARALSDCELLAMVIRKGSRNLDVLGVSNRLLAEAGSLENLLKWSVADLCRVDGLGTVKALQIQAVLEIGRRLLCQEMGETPELSTPEEVYRFMIPHALGLETEKFWTLCLNRKNRLLRLVEVTSGTATSSLAHPREVFREAIRHGSAAVIIVHNHPSGDPLPSTADIKITRQLCEAADILQIDLHDHLVLGNAGRDPSGRGYYSFRESGWLRT